MVLRAIVKWTKLLEAKSFCAETAWRKLRKGATDLIMQCHLEVS